ncbi:50S ribosome-binding GTPase [Paraburkholderia fungorum]|uniref:50S ribosome-binding GTPase n=1 Tax=Paraburkholderia fungorum TaxID=134537 RepID=A0A1H1IC89_9BURK|nr:GTPase [Paraburkholderia fungorum]SDR34948.1 50S ribosome-binding GTPase [Paraburkholderia fungorum]
MKADVTSEQRFIADVDAFEFIDSELETILHLLEDWLARLTTTLQLQHLTSAGLAQHNSLATLAEATNTLLRNSVPAWAQQWANLKPAQALAESFDDKALLLVFGKFNAGKSSFCNFLADRFAAYSKTVEYFYLDGGRIVATPERFSEGVTETTARMQGVCLGGKLVLVDTPGLHSATPDNAALTQRFTDSADGVLWLTSSTSPGQVQELDELGRELHRNKPLLPVVTRSDVYEEDEIDGEIRKCLRGKSAQNRADQENDVKARAEEKLVAMGVSTSLLKPPVSISAYLARAQNQTPAAMIESGFERLYDALLDVAEATLAYKRRKLAEMFLHHLEENVLGTLCVDAMSMLAQLQSLSAAALDDLERQQEHIIRSVWRSVVPTLPDLLEQHSATRDVKAICNSLSQTVTASFSREVNQRLGDYVIEPEASAAGIELGEDAQFEDIVIESDTTSGPIRKVVGVDYQRLHAALGKAIQQHIVQLSSHAVGQCNASIKQLMQRASSLQDSLQMHERDLLSLKATLRSDFA